MTREALRRLFPWIQLGAVAAVGPLLLLPRMEWMAVALIIPLLWIAGFLIRGHFIEPSPLNPLLLPLLVMVGVSVWATFDIEFSLGKIAGTLLGVASFLAAVQWMDRTARLWIGAGAFAVLGVLFAVLGFFITPFRSKLPIVGALIPHLPARLSLPVPEGSLNANPVAGTLVLFIPGLALLGWELLRPSEGNAGHRWLGRAALGACVGATMVLGLTQSRGAWTGLLGAAGFLLVVRSPWWRWVAVATLVPIVFSLLLWLPLESADLTEVADIGADEIGLEARLEIWNRALYGIQDFPFTGMGMNAFRKVVHLLYPLFLIPPDADIASAHNQFLQTALDLGIPGLAAYVGLWAALGRMLWLMARHTGDRFRRSLSLGLAGGFLAQLVFLVTDAIPLGAKLGIFWWMASSLAVALFKLEFGAAGPGRWRVFEIFLTWVLVSLVSIAFVGDHPYPSLALAILGGIYLGFLTISDVGGHQEEASRVGAGR